MRIKLLIIGLFLSSCGIKSVTSRIMKLEDEKQQLTQSAEASPTKLVKTNLTKLAVTDIDRELAFYKYRLNQKLLRKNRSARLLADFLIKKNASTKKVKDEKNNKKLEKAKQDDSSKNISDSTTTKSNEKEVSSKTEEEKLQSFDSSPSQVKKSKSEKSSRKSKN